MNRSSSSSSSSLLFFTCLGSVIAFGSVLIFVRRVFNPHTAADNGGGGGDDDHDSIAMTLQRVDINLGLGINQFRLDLDLLFALSPQLPSALRRRFYLFVRIGGNHRHEMVVLLLLLLVRSQAAPILLPLLEDIDFAAVSYLRILRCPRFVFTVV